MLPRFQHRLCPVGGLYATFVPDFPSYCRAHLVPIGLPWGTPLLEKWVPDNYSSGLS